MSTELPAVPETVDALLEHTRPSLDRQLGTADALDQKMVAALAVSFVLVGLVSLGDLRGSGPLTAVLISGAWAAWLIGTGVAVRSLWTVKYSVAGAADRWAGYQVYEPTAVKLDMLTELRRAYEANRDKNARKAKALRRVMAAVIAQTALVAAALISAALT